MEGALAGWFSHGPLVFSLGKDCRLAAPRLAYISDQAFPVERQHRDRCYSAQPVVSPVVV
jgi:hypothetical protein